MSVKYESGSEIDPELRGTVDFDFFETPRDGTGKSQEHDNKESNNSEGRCHNLKEKAQHEQGPAG